jgi:hypothetical protein
MPQSFRTVATWLQRRVMAVTVASQHLGGLTIFEGSGGLRTHWTSKFSGGMTVPGDWGGTGRALARAPGLR